MGHTRELDTGYTQRFVEILFINQNENSRSVEYNKGTKVLFLLILE
jgi:hypothetical protein